LQHFGQKEAERNGPEIVFPPAGVILAYDPTFPVVARVTDGAPPFTWLWNGAPVVTGARDREVMLEAPGAGFGLLTVIDSRGRAARVGVELTVP
jgi:penicillin-binding protein 1C